MGTRASAGGEGGRGGDRAKSARDHAEGSGRAHPCGSTSPLWSCFVTHLCNEVPEHADEEHGEGDGDHHPVPHVGVEHPFFLFRFEGRQVLSAISVVEASVRERDSERKGSFSAEATGDPARPERHRRRHLQHGCHTCLSLASSAPAAVGVADELSSGGFRWHPPFEISPVQILAKDASV